MEPRLNTSRSEDRQLAEACLAQDPVALEELRRLHLSPLRGILTNRGANVTEAEDLIGGLWADCTVGRGERGPLLEKFNGKCSLHNWLATVATHLLYDQLRRKKFHAEITPRSPEERVEEVLERLGALMENPSDSDLTRLLLASLEQAFGGCPPEEHLMIRLLYFHGISQRDLCRMWRWSEPKISRRLKATMEEIKQNTLSHIAQADPDLKLQWEDFEELCHTQQLAFL